MSETSSLSELASFAGQSRLGTERQPARRKAMNALTAGLRPKLQRHGVADLLGVVLVLSARTRRMGLPKAGIDLDVFSPNGRRAVRMVLPR